jgi:hypothetical protein
MYTPVIHKVDLFYDLSVCLEYPGNAVSQKVIPYMAKMQGFICIGRRKFNKYVIRFRKPLITLKSLISGIPVRKCPSSSPASRGDFLIIPARGKTTSVISPINSLLVFWSWTSEFPGFAMDFSVRYRFTAEVIMLSILIGTGSDSTGKWFEHAKIIRIRQSNGLLHNSDIGIDGFFLLFCLAWAKN